jgi:hypothetical protein
MYYTEIILVYACLWLVAVLFPASHRFKAFTGGFPSAGLICRMSGLSEVVL